MLVNELRTKFITLKDYEPTHDELLDFARQNYLHGILNIREFRSIICDLEKDGARVPDFTNEDLVDEYVEQ